MVLYSIHGVETSVQTHQIENLARKTNSTKEQGQRPQDERGGTKGTRGPTQNTNNAAKGPRHPTPQRAFVLFSWRHCRQPPPGIQWGSAEKSHLRKKGKTKDTLAIERKNSSMMCMRAWHGDSFNEPGQTIMNIFNCRHCELIGPC